MLNGVRTHKICKWARIKTHIFPHVNLRHLLAEVVYFFVIIIIICINWTVIVYILNFNAYPTIFENNFQKWNCSVQLHHYSSWLLDLPSFIIGFLIWLFPLHYILWSAPFCHQMDFVRADRVTLVSYFFGYCFCIVETFLFCFTK